jgi:hypothetical protein
MYYKRIGMAAVLGLLLVALAPAADVEGVLIDQMCSMKAVKEGQKAAAMHTKDCALMPDCVNSGYGVYTSDGKFLKFDAKGNQEAQKALKATKQKDNLKVKVSGNIDGDTIKVSSLKLG